MQVFGIIKANTFDNNLVCVQVSLRTSVLGGLVPRCAPSNIWEPGYVSCTAVLMHGMDKVHVYVGESASGHVQKKE